MAWTRKFRGLNLSRRSTSARSLSNLSRYQIGTVNSAVASWTTITNATQANLQTLTDADFQGNAVKVPGLARYDLSLAIQPTSLASAFVDVFCIRIPAAVTTPTLTSALNWADLLKGIQVLGYKRFVVGTTTIPRLMRLKVRSFPNLSVSEEVRTFMVVRPINAVSTTGAFQIIGVPKFRVA